MASTNRSLHKFLPAAFFVAALALVGWFTFAPDSNTRSTSMTQTPDKIITIEGVTEYRLDNGLTVLLFPETSKATATVCMTYLVGSRHEGYGETGMAHLLEHLMFKGSQNFPKPTEEFTKRGFDMNGSTWLDRTNYHVTFKATDDNLDWALRWSADAMVNSFIAQKDLDTEMTVVRNEYEMGENRPISVMLKRMQSVLFDWHNYGNATIGAKSDIELVKIENLQAFYRKYYQPDNAVLTVSGKFDEKAALEKITQIFGVIPRPERRLEPMWTQEPVADGPRRFEIRRSGASRVVAIGYRIPAAIHPDSQAVSLASDILGDTPRGRLHKALVEKGLATEVFAWPMAGYDPSLVMFGAILPEKADADKVEKLMIDVIENDLVRHPVTKDELETQITEETTEYERMFADPETFATDISDFIALGDWKLFFIQRDAWKNYTADDVTRVARDYFVRDNRVVGVFIPDEAPKRARFTPAPTLKEVLDKATFKEEAGVAEDFVATPESIMTKTEIIREGGLTIALMPKQNRANDVDVAVRLHWGNVDSLKGKVAYPEMLSEMLERGTDKHSRDEIENLFTTYRVKGSITRFKAKGKTLPETLELVGELLNRSAFNAGVFEELKREVLTETEMKLDDPAKKAADAMCRHFNTYPLGDPRHVLCSSEKIEAVKPMDAANLKRFYESTFATDEAIIAIVGDFDKEAVKRVLPVVFTKHAKTSYERVVGRYAPVKATHIAIDTPDKENAVLVFARHFKKPETERERTAMKLANWIFGGSHGLSNRLINRVRQKEGLSYGIGSYVNFSRFGDISRWTASAILAPQNIERAKAAIYEEIRRIVTDGISQKELEEGKSGMLDSRLTALADDALVAQSWVKLLDEGKDFTDVKRMDDLIANLTLEEVNAAIRSLLIESEITVIEAGDLKKAHP